MVELDRTLIKNSRQTQQGRSVIVQTAEAQSAVIKLDYVPTRLSATNIARPAAYVLAGLILLLVLTRVIVVVGYRRHAAHRVEVATPYVVQPTIEPPKSSGDDWRR